MATVKLPRTISAIPSFKVKAAPESDSSPNAMIAFRTSVTTKVMSATIVPPCFVTNFTRTVLSPKIFNFLPLAVLKAKSGGAGIMRTCVAK